MKTVVQIVRAQGEKWWANAWKRLASSLSLSLCLTRLKCKFIQINDNLTGHDLEKSNHLTVGYISLTESSTVKPLKFRHRKDRAKCPYWIGHYDDVTSKFPLTVWSIQLLDQDKECRVKFLIN